MWNLILAICCSAVISGAMRLSESYRKNHISMLAVNYLACLLLGLLHTGGSVIPTGSQLQSGEFRFSLLLGALQGLLYMGSFLLLQANITKNGVVLSGMFMKLGVLVPTVCAILFFGEKPTLPNVVGFTAAVAAILMINLEKGGAKVQSGIGLIFLMMGGGVTDVMAKIYETAGSPEYKNQFLLFTFVTAFLFCTLVTLWKKQGLCSADVLWGLLIGIPNYYSARFLLNSLQDVPAVIAYPTYSVSTIVLISLTGILFFKEKFSRRQKAALGIILLSLILLNL